MIFDASVAALAVGRLLAEFERGGRSTSPASGAGLLQWRADDQNHLALYRLVGIGWSARSPQCPAPEFLEGLGKLPADGSRTLLNRTRSDPQRQQAYRRCDGGSRRRSVSPVPRRNSARRSRRALSLVGRKPANRKASFGRPEPTSAASGADAPGIGTTRWPASIASCPRR